METIASTETRAPAPQRRGWLDLQITDVVLTLCPPGIQVVCFADGGFVATFGGRVAGPLLKI